MPSCIGLSLLTLLLSLRLLLVNGQFGIGRKHQQEQQLDEVVVGDDNNNLFDLDDPEFQMAIEMFSKMSPEEMEETMHLMKELLGDDPETMAAINDVLTEIPKMKAADVESSLLDMVEDDEVLAATFDALQMLRSTENAWETIWEQRDVILEAVIASGQIAPMDEARFRNDPQEWEAELKHIWMELQNQAESVVSGDQSLKS